MQFYKNRSIGRKLFIVYAVIYFSVFSLSYYLLFFQVKSYLESNIKEELKKTNTTITDMIEIAAKVSVKNHLNSIASEKKGLVRHIYDHYLNGEITEDTAKKQAIDILLKEKVGKTGYLYCIDSKGLVRVHPQKALMGKSLVEYEFIKEQMKKKNGYLEYNWKNPGEEVKRPKALYMAYFEPWDWIISVSSYKEEFNSLISVDDFRDQILNLKFGNSGYSFMLDSEGNTLIHPRFSGNIADVEDEKGQTTLREILKKKTGILFYRWKNDNDKDFRDKIVAFNHIPGFNWIIASSSYTEEIFNPLDRIKSLFIFILFFTMVITFFVTLIVSSSITKPLTELINHFKRGVDDPAYLDTSFRLSEAREDEIGQLSESYNKFMETLSKNRNELLAEIQQRKEVENQLRLFEKVFENVSEGISITDEDGNIEAVNQAFTDITGYEAHEVLGNNPRILKSDRHDKAFYKRMWDSLMKSGHWVGEIWNRKKSGEAYPELLSINAIKENEEKTKRYVAVFRDISDIKLKEEEIERLAYHDALTNLPNRSLLKDRLKQAMTEAKRSREMIQVLFLDLDNFKNVNDSIGHHWGDMLLKAVADRMLSVVRSGDTVSRFGGDEFIIIIPHIKNTTEMAFMVERIQSVFKNPFVLDNHIFNITSSIGVSVFPGDGTDVDSLIKHADLAMYQAKQAGKDKYSMFEPEMARMVKERVQLESEIRHAIENDDFVVYLQPRIDIETFKPNGMEALVRWIKEDGKIIPPDSFIPLAEESGLIVPIGEMVFRKSVNSALKLRDETGLDLLISINVSIRQFDDPAFMDMVASILNETGYPSDRLEIEITESLLIKDTEITLEKLKKISSMGIRTAIDDFGTGYSSLSYLRKLPINVIKIDRSFIDEIAENTDNQIMTSTITLLARSLNLDIVAEGVENEEQLEILKNLGKMEVQGYYFAKPMPCSDFKKWLLEKRYYDNKK